MSTANGNGAAARTITRCGIYTRKSTTEGLDMDFNTLDAQREASEHYIRSQAAQGWTVLPTRYDDGGFTGGNLERPAMQRLLDDIERGEVDMVVVYKVDRLSRSLLDFARLMEKFDKKRIGFVSITQHFDTSTSMGRLILNVLLSFAQFEREIISERTRDKIAAARRRGKWTGGPPVLGYRLDSDRRVLTIEPDEAAVVRLAFEFYLRTNSIGIVAEQLNALGHHQKRRTTKGGRSIGGRSWDKNAVHRLLRNPLYAGKVSQGGSLYAGEHEPIVGWDVFSRVQQTLDHRSTGQGPRRSRRSEYLLSGILRCAACDAAMVSTAGHGRGGKRYRYYRCLRHRNAASDCPTEVIAAEEIEERVIGAVRELGQRGEVQRVVLDQLATDEVPSDDFRAQHERLASRLAELNTEAKRLLAAFADAGSGGKLLASRLGELEAEMDQVRGQLEEVESQLQGSRASRDDATRAVELLTAFDGIWDTLVPMERRELLHLVVRRVWVDSTAKDLRLQFHELSGSATPDPAADAETKPAEVTA
jgi:site-specific DNA recombinase